MTHFEKIQEGAQKMGIQLRDSVVEQLVSYLTLLQKWNKAYNLTAIRDPDAMIHLHLLDSLSVLPYIKGNRIIDVGTGPGLPGMILAICYPDKTFTLLDSNGKKTRFLTQAKMELGLDNVSVANERVENHQAIGGYDHVISRAFASIIDMITWTRPLPNPTGNFLAMKGVYPVEELAVLPEDIEVELVERLPVPGIDAERHLVVMKRKG